MYVIVRSCLLGSNTRNAEAGRYNTPAADEVAVLMPGNEVVEGSKRYIQLYLQRGGTEFIDELHKYYDTWAYILFHLYGDEGWKRNTPYMAKMVMLLCDSFTLIVLWIAMNI